jgi:NAD(P)H-hydrate epimerase
MRVAAFNAASLLCSQYAEQTRRGVTVYTGAGNNGGDGWVLAAALASCGFPVCVREIAASRTDDAVAERALAKPLSHTSHGLPGVVVDAMLGTGSRGALSGAFLDAARDIAAARRSGAIVVALDLPSGLDATHGATHGATTESVVADLTISFGSCKRGTLVSRAACGEIAIIDIGLGASNLSLPTLVDESFVATHTPVIEPDAHKGTRKSVAIVAGSDNMGGAAILAATAALRSGAGLVQVITALGNVSAVHTRIPEALVGSLDDASAIIHDWADAVLIGPGLSSDDATRSFVRDVLAKWRGPVVVDAGAISAFDGDLPALGAVLRGRPAVLTPHPGELAKLLGRQIQEILDNRFDVGVEVARRLGAAVLLKGTPTVVFDPDGARHVSAAGTPVLATGGSGDSLGGIVATLLAQGCGPSIAAACAAWIHGRAAELTPGVRGFRLTDVLDMLPQAWNTTPSPNRYPVLALLPRVS